MDQAPVLALRLIVQSLGAAGTIIGFAGLSTRYRAVARSVALATVRTGSPEIAARCLRLWPSIREIDLRTAESTLAADVHRLAPLLRRIRVLRMNNVKGRLNIASIFRSAPDLEEFDARTAHDSTLQLSSAVDAPVPPLRVFRANGLSQHSHHSMRYLIAKAAPTLSRLCVAAQPNAAIGVLLQLRLSAVPLRELVLGQSGPGHDTTLWLYLTQQGYSLEWLDLSHCGDLSAVPWSTWRECAAGGLAVTTLILDGCTLGPELVHAVSRARSLHTISLRGCRGVKDAIVQATAAAAAETLVHCDLTGTAVTDAGVQRIIQRCTRLQSLRLDSCRGVTRSLRRAAREGRLVAVPAPAPARESLASNKEVVRASEEVEDAASKRAGKPRRGRKRQRVGLLGVADDSDGEWAP